MPVLALNCLKNQKGFPFLLSNASEASFLH